MRVVLADPPQLEEYYELIFPTMGILYIIGYARPRFEDSGVEFIYLQGQCTLKEHLEQVRTLKPDLYGISFKSPVSSLAYKTINAVKEMRPDLPIISGGAHPTGLWAEVLEQSATDVCVVGEGEETFSQLVEHFRDGRPEMESIPGVAYRNGGQPHYTGKRPFIPDINTIPFPAWDLVDFSRYMGLQYKKRTPYSGVVVSRGCFLDCTFCSNPIWKDNKPWVRLRSPENIAQEVRQLYEMGIRELRLHCDELNVSKRWTVEVCQALERLGYRDLYFTSNILANRLTEEMAEAFRRINLWMVYIGMESGNPETLAGIGKGVTKEDIVNACRIIKRHGLNVYGYFMLYNVWEAPDGELLYESPEQVDNTVRFANRLAQDGLLDYMSWQVATPLPGSRLWGIAERHDLLPPADNGRRRYYWDQTLRLPGITQRQVQRSLRKGARLKAMVALRNGNIDWHQASRRIWENLKALSGLARR